MLPKPLCQVMNDCCNDMGYIFNSQVWRTLCIGLGDVDAGQGIVRNKIAKELHCTLASMLTCFDDARKRNASITWRAMWFKHICWHHFFMPKGGSTCVLQAMMHFQRTMMN